MCWLTGSRMDVQADVLSPHFHKNSSSIPTAPQQRWKSFQPFLLCVFLFYFFFSLSYRSHPFQSKSAPPPFPLVGSSYCLSMLSSTALSISPFDIGKRHLTFCPNNDGVRGQKERNLLFIQSAAGPLQTEQKANKNRNNDNNMEIKGGNSSITLARRSFPFWRVTRNEMSFFSLFSFSMRTNLLDRPE